MFIYRMTDQDDQMGFLPGELTASSSSPSLFFKAKCLNSPGGLMSKSHFLLSIFIFVLH